jgi:hypothetical protein
MKSRDIMTVAAGLLMPHLGCQGGDAVPSYSTRDSAGIRIVTSERATWTESRQWRLSDEPTLALGAQEDPEEYQLYRVTGSLRLSDGRIVIANAGTAELRFYDSSGRFLGSTGRSGEGPGEFGTISAVYEIPGDSLLVWDSGNRRISILDPRGAFRRALPPGPFAQEPVFISVVAPLPDGTLLVGAFSFRFAQAAVQLGLGRDTVILVRCDRHGEPIDTVALYQGTEWFTTRESPRTDVPFARDSYLASSSGGYYWGDNATWEISFRNDEGAVQRIMRTTTPLVEVTPEDVQAQKQRWLADIGRDDVRQQVAEMLEPVQGPPTMPAFSALRIDAAGNLWAQQYQIQADEPVRWTVFDPDGVMLGTVTMPARFFVHQIGHDFVLGRWRNDLDVEHVLMYELTKP